MLEIPEEIKNLFRSDNIFGETRKKFKLTFYNDKIESLYPYETLFPAEDLFPSEHDKPWLVIENDRIESESLTITESLSESEDMEFGSCEAAMMEIIVADVIEDITGKEFTLTVEIGGYEMAFGIYTVESFVRQADRRKRKITAYDRMRWFNTDVSSWYNDLKFPMTLKSFRDSLCEYIGITQSAEGLIFDGLQIAKTIEPQQISGLDVLKAICQLNGCFGHIDKTGQLIYIHLQQTGLYPSEDLFPDEKLYPSEFGGDGLPIELVSTFKNLTYEDYQVEGITGLSIRQEDGDIGSNVGNGENPYIVEGNFLVYGKNASELMDISNSLLGVISSKVYRPSDLDCVGMPWIEVGDAFRIITQNDIVETFVMKRVTKGCQALRDNITSTGSQRREEVFGINKQIIQLEGKTAVIIKNVDEVSARVTDLKNYTEAEFKITSDRITSEVKRLDDENEKQYSKIEQNAQQIALRVVKGTISSELSLEPGKVTLSSNRLIVESTNFKLDGNGNATFSGTVQSAAIKSSNISGGSININNIFKVDTSGNTSITGNNFSWSATNSSMTRDGTLSCNNIKATNGNFTGNITGSNISGGSIRGSYVSGSTITGSSINVGPFSADDEIVELGDFYVSADGSNVFASHDGSVAIQTRAGGPLGSYPTLQLTERSGRPTIISGHHISVSNIMPYEVFPQNSWWNGWSLTRTCEDLWDAVFNGSDIRLKENIIKIDKNESLDFVLQSNPVTFQYKKDGKWSAGFIAQEVDELQDKLGIYYPLVKFEEKSQKYRIEYENYIPILVSSIQNIQDQIDMIKKELA